MSPAHAPMHNKACGVYVLANPKTMRPRSTCKTLPRTELLAPSKIQTLLLIDICAEDASSHRDAYATLAPEQCSEWVAVKRGRRADVRANRP